VAYFGIQLPFSRVHETEADHLGLIYRAKAGYDPAAAIRFWERMEQATGTRRPEFLSTHPSPATRRADIQAWLPEANRYYAQGPTERPAVVAAKAVPLPPPGSPPATAQEGDEPAEAPTFAGSAVSLEDQLRSLTALLTRGLVTETEHGLLRN
jgi:hypothetical protein